MKKYLFKLLSTNARLEVLLRLIWGIIPVGLKQSFIGEAKPSRHSLPSKSLMEVASIGLDAENIIDRLPLADGDTFIFHSSGKALKYLGISVEDFAFQLEKRCRTSSLTGLIPSYPKLTHASSGTTGVLVWDSNADIQSTGALGSIYTSWRAGIGRSALPFNNLTVIGPEANDLDNLENVTVADYPCGPGTIWSTAWDRNAKIIIFGVDIASCLTFLHVPEDHDPCKWEPLRWYHSRNVEIINGDQKKRCKMRVRRKSASLFYAERSFDSDLQRYVFQDHSIAGVPIFVGRAHDLTDYLAERRRKIPTYPYYFTWLLRYV